MPFFGTGALGVAVRWLKRLPILRLLQEWVRKPYFFALFILLVVAISALYRAKAHSQGEADELLLPVNSPRNASSPVSENADPLELMEKDPWHFFYPEWKRQEGQSFFSILSDNSQSLPDSVVKEINQYVDDPKQKMEKDFQVPLALKSRVKFWVEIYSRYSSRIKVVHDRNNLEVIYGYIDLRPIYRVSASNIEAESRGLRIEKRILKELKARLSDSIGLTATNSVDAKEKNEIKTMLSRYGALSTKDTQKLLAEIRTQSGQSDMFLAALFRSKNLLPHIESVFKRQKLPTALARIPFVESSFNVKAHSKIGAVGIWQFTPETAQQMIRGSEEKSWSDPLKQTSSAAKLLILYRSMLPDWGITVTSYNSGVGRLRRLSARYHLKHAEDLFKLPEKDALGFAGNNFYSEFLAANLVEAYKDEIFSKMLTPVDMARVFQGPLPFPKEICDLQVGLKSGD